ncbi:efflux RND transporter periplasmic adaptor subunit [Pseudoalteromonas citrea]|uniref:Efflux RND transporter periplasmic adaptor subunit n=1 Tax=Pseudoalteromonas citrea TaxID=43655 RepID=A0A5S3XH15_9GAMM|nr:efflux RND transporter periplasmic adaptor subunit [Pseudoalteromonas citrea]TMP42363.1 efflux RND transporter periplasmic adaptor subunit [Pseudoalteromonas citrea]TMP52823.1 efflux RND transporter periplasmic adaptor subunit [Pseudoalteromonas citrea]
MQFAVRAVFCVVLASASLVASKVYAQTTEVDIYIPSLNKQADVMRLTGTIEATRDASLASLEAGAVSVLQVDVGSLVKKGEVLLQLDDTLAKLELAQAKASLQAATVAKQEAERLLAEVVALSDQQSVAKTLIGERRANLANTKAELVKQQAAVSLAKEIVHRHTLYAPFSGVIASRNVDVGEWVTPQNSVFSLVAQSDLRLVLDVPQEYYSDFASQERVSAAVTADIKNSHTINTQISRLVGVADPVSRTFVAHIDIPNETYSHEFIAGMSASAEVFLASSKSKVWLPKSAIKQHPDGGSSVFSIENGSAKRSLVTVVESTGEQVSVIGLTGSERIVVSGVELLKDGTSLSVKSTVSGEL